MKIVSVALVSTLVFVASQAFAHPDHSLERPFGATSPPVPSKPGRPGLGASRTIEVEMTEQGRCIPTEIPAKQGETLKLRATNSAPVPQDLAIGTESELKSHAETIRKFPQMQGTQANRVNVKPGQPAELVWEFAKPGPFSVSCARAGSFDAANAGKIIVSPR